MSRTLHISAFVCSLVAIGILASCYDPDSEYSVCLQYATPPDSLDYKPIYEQPINLTTDSIYFAHEQAQIAWKLPEGLISTEIQGIRFNRPFTCEDYTEFHKLGFSGGEFGVGYGNQYGHYIYLGADLADTVFVAYRLRSAGLEVGGYSAWTPVRSMIILPIVYLDKHRLIVNYDFDILTEELNQEYYSGITELKGYRLEEIARENGLDPSQVVVVRPVASRWYFTSRFEDGKCPFSRAIAGFDERVEENSAYPFDALTEGRPGTYEESPVPGTIYPHGGQYRNMRDELQEFDIKLAYDLEDAVGKQHQVRLQFEYDFYLTD